MATLNVGANLQYTTLSSAIAASHDGDIIRVRAGTYTNDFATITTKISIVGVGGMVNLVATKPPPNGKGILVTTTDVSLNHISFSGSAVADGNGAGLRYEGGNLTINHCYFHDNQDGLLAASDPSGTITINNSEFARNGAGDGQTHNLYVNEVGVLKINNSYFHDAVLGHEIKSRADKTIIQNNRIFDQKGTSSYSIDLPNGGNALIRYNTIEQGPNSQNPAIIHVGGETGIYAATSIRVENNTILNDLKSTSARAVLNQSNSIVSIKQNSFYGLTSGQIASGPATVSGSSFLTAEPILNASQPWDNVVATGALTLGLAQNNEQTTPQFISASDQTNAPDVSAVTPHSSNDSTWLNTLRQRISGGGPMDAPAALGREFPGRTLPVPPSAGFAPHTQTNIASAIIPDLDKIA